MDASQWKLQDMNHQVQESRKVARPPTINCPRCKSSNTKFCYYNNYSLTQPRYFCKACRRYWTQGGSLRNVPVGGSSRKNKRSVSSSSTVPKPLDLSTQHLNLGFHHTNTNHLNFLSSSSSASSTLTCVSAQDFLSTGTEFNTAAMINSNPMLNVQVFRPTIGFPFHERGDHEDSGKAFQVMNRSSTRERESGSTGYWN